jgi:hypothetical protein
MKRVVTFFSIYIIDKTFANPPLFIYYTWVVLTMINFRSFSYKVELIYILLTELLIEVL